MNKATFERLIITPNSISDNEAALLEDLAKVFPYCQLAHLLLAKESQEKKSMLYPKKLRKASAYMLDRRILHSIIHSSSNSKNNKEDSNYSTTEFSEINFKIKKPSISTPSNAAILEEIGSILKEITEKKPAILYPPTISQNQFAFQTESRLGDECGLEINNDNNGENLDLILAYLERKKNTSHITNKSFLPKVDVIDRFLEATPKINRPIPNVLSEGETHDLSKESTELKIELTTENYAQILVKQNKIDKAIEVYKKLALKYPDKSAYFAAKSNELENK